jgi:hypothetical protein
MTIANRSICIDIIAVKCGKSPTRYFCSVLFLSLLFSHLKVVCACIIICTGALCPDQENLLPKKVFTTFFDSLCHFSLLFSIPAQNKILFG